MLHGLSPVLGLVALFQDPVTTSSATPDSTPVVAEALPITEASPAAAAPATEPAGDVVEPVECPEFGLTGDWGGLRADLAEAGVTIELSAILEANRVLDGGVAQITTAHALYDLLLTFDLGRIAGLDGGVLVADAYAIDGHNPSDEVGDAQSFSDISADETSQIGEVYYEQWLFERRARLKFGKIDANSEFASPTVMGENFHSAAAYSPTAFTMVTYPNPSSGALVGYAYDDVTTLKLGVFDGAAARGFQTGSNGPSTLWGSPSDLLWLGQIERRWELGEDARPGGAVIGTWQHAGGEFTTFDGDVEDSTGGYYLAFDQELARVARGESTSSTLGVLQFGWPTRTSRRSTSTSARASRSRASPTNVPTTRSASTRAGPASAMTRRSPPTPRPRSRSATSASSPRASSCGPTCSTSRSRAATRRPRTCSSRACASN